MPEIIRKIHGLLIKKRKKIAVAESCTGGLLSELLTRLSGSSGYFVLGIISYADSAKSKILKIPPALIRRKGAVSREVAVKMASTARKLARADFGIGITGIAGPTGGSPQKPVGTVFIALGNKKKTVCHRYVFKGGRSSIRKKTALKSLELLKKALA